MDRKPASENKGIIWERWREADWLPTRSELLLTRALPLSHPTRENLKDCHVNIFRNTAQRYFTIVIPKFLPQSFRRQNMAMFFALEMVPFVHWYQLCQ